MQGGEGGMNIGASGAGVRWSGVAMSDGFLSVSSVCICRMGRARISCRLYQSKRKQMMERHSDEIKR